MTSWNRCRVLLLFWIIRYTHSFHTVLITNIILMRSASDVYWKYLSFRLDVNYFIFYSNFFKYFNINLTIQNGLKTIMSKVRYVLNGLLDFVNSETLNQFQLLITN